MGFIIYQHKYLIEQLEEAKTRGGIASEAAIKAKQIITDLSTDTYDDPTLVIRHMGQQEHRIKNCRKIYLQGGYRLIFIRMGNCLIFCFFGEHDECFRWVESNKGRRLILHEMLDIYSIQYDTVDTHNTNKLTESLEKDFEDELMQYDIPEEKYEEDVYIKQYEDFLMARVNSTEGQRILSGWFK